MGHPARLMRGTFCCVRSGREPTEPGYRRTIFGLFLPLSALRVSTIAFECLSSSRKSNSAWAVATTAQSKLRIVAGVSRTLLRSPAFGRDLRKWLKAHADTAATVEETLDQLSADAMHPSLRTHKLIGQLAGCWACRAGYDLRIVFEFTEHEGAEANPVAGPGHARSRLLTPTSSLNPPGSSGFGTGEAGWGLREGG